MKLIEKFVLGKKNKEVLCEDAIFFNEHFACVIDGATSKSNQLHNGLTSGKMAAQLILKCISQLPAHINKIDFFKSINNSIKNYYVNTSEYSLDFFAKNPIERATASVIVYSNYYKKIWSVGDCQCKIGKRYYIFEKSVDDILANTRALYIELALLKGVSKEELMENDMGRAFILPLLKEQIHLQNTTTSRYYYNAIDGFFWDADSIGELSLEDKDVKTIILASDGYPRLFDTLKETEAYLKNVLINDPLLYQEHKTTKGLNPNHISYDDRAFIKIEI